MSTPLKDDSEDTESGGASSVTQINIRNLKKNVKYMAWPPVKVEIDTMDSNKDTETSDDSNFHPIKKRKVLRMKRKKANSVVTHVCQECMARFPSPVALALHLQIHYNKKIVCLTCQKQFPDKVELDIHLRQVHTKPTKISCINCRKTFTYRSYSSKQVYRNDYLCFFCNRRGFIRPKTT